MTSKIPQDTSRDHRTTALGLGRYARDYYRAACAVNDALGQDEGHKISAPVPALHLMAHSIELILKAFLRHKGRTLKDLEDLRHDVVKIFSECKKCGLSDVVEICDNDEETIKFIGELHKSTCLRYIVTGWMQLPVFGPLQEVTEKLLKGILPEVGWTRKI